MNMDVVSKLPPEIQTMLKRKSSRDPSSRFAAKLHALLKHVSQYPQLENEIGLAWIDDETFKMNKHNLSAVMGIKLNTLNVNLRDLRFTQQQHNKDGWTHWKKEGFTRSATGLMQDTTPKYSAMRPADLWMPQQPARFMRPTIGKMPIEHVQAFFDRAHNLWSRITDSRERMGAVSIDRAARVLKQDGQELQNAIEVLQAIISPTGGDTATFDQLVKFLAMFGPERTAMLKISSLLRCSQKTGQWLRFLTQEPMPEPYAVFDDNEPNCLVIRKHGLVSRVWNLPLIDHGDRQAYLVDENDQKYSSWDEYFDTHPINPPLSYMDLPYAPYDSSLN